MEQLKITILNDNKPGRKLLSEHGLSFLIEYKGEHVLLDTGASDVFMRNAQALNINLHAVKNIVLSHGHWDHGDGLLHLGGQTLITHPHSFQKRYHRQRNRTYVGLKMGLAEAAEQYDLQLSKVPVPLSPEIMYLGEVPRRNEFEAAQTAFEDEQGEDDYILDDSGLVIRTEKGLVVISGCAHAGICNTVEYAMRITGEQRVLAVIGGFHLKKADRLTEKTIEWLKQKSVKYVIPSHCTDLPALSLFHRAFRFKQLCTGDVLKF